MAIRELAGRLAVCSVLAMTACSTTPGDDDDDDGNGINTVNVDSGDTATCAVGDTGCIVSLSIVEQGMVDTDAGTYEGFEAATFRWLGSGWTPTVGGSSVCSLVRHTRDWENDDSRDGEDNPLSEAELAACTECDFTFTLSATEGAAEEEIPWIHDVDTEDTEDDDNIVAFDPDNDWTYTFPDVETRTVNCESVGLSDMAPEDFSYGIGFQAADGLDAPYGSVMYWSEDDSEWIPLTGTEESPPGVGVYVEDEGRFLYEILSAYAIVSL